MKQINIIGTIFGSSGYDSHTRQLTSALFEKERVKLTTNLIPNWQRFCKDYELEMIKRESENNETNLIITNPTFWRLNLGPEKNIAYFVWEGDRVPEWFIGEITNPKIDKVIVPSQHTYDAIVNTLFDYHKNKGEFDEKEEGSTTFSSGLWHYKGSLMWEKLKVVHHGVDTKLFFPKKRNHDSFRFFANKGLTDIEDRGGIQYLIQAYLEEFKLSDNTELVVKVNPAYKITDLNKIVNDLSPKNRKDLPKIVFITDNIPFEKMPELYQETDVFVSPTRAEAFNLPCLEAMACGKPVITTNFGGQVEYVNNKNGWVISGELEEVKHDINYEGCKWLTPYIEELREVLKDAYSNQDKVWEKGNNALKTAKKMTWNNTADKILEIIANNNEK